jgi:hypothetical protein
VTIRHRSRDAMESINGWLLVYLIVWCRCRFLRHVPNDEEYA